jgi:hypothetical protein
VPLVEFAINDSASTLGSGYTPFFADRGQHPRRPLSPPDVPDQAAPAESDQAATHLMARITAEGRGRCFRSSGTGAGRRLTLTCSLRYVARCYATRSTRSFPRARSSPPAGWARARFLHKKYPTPTALTFRLRGAWFWSSTCSACDPTAAAQATEKLPIDILINIVSNLRFDTPALDCWGRNHRIVERDLDGIGRRELPTPRNRVHLV